MILELAKTEKDVTETLELCTKQGFSVRTEINVTDTSNILTYKMTALVDERGDGCKSIKELGELSFELDDDVLDKCPKPNCSSVYRFGVKMIKDCLENVSMKTLYDTMFVFSNASFYMGHRDKYLNCLEWILDDNATDSLYRTVTYGVCPASECTYAIGDLTGRRRDNYEIYHFLLIEKKSELKEWLLENHNFTDDEKRLLHYFRDGGAE